MSTLSGAEADIPVASSPIRLLHFFATWCEPCREEFATLDRLQSLEPGLVSILSVSVAEVAIRVRKFIEATAPGFVVFLDPERRTARAWGVSSLPTTFVLDALQTPRLVVERDIDWTRTDVRAALRRLAN